MGSLGVHKIYSMHLWLAYGAVMFSSYSFIQYHGEDKVKYLVLAIRMRDNLVVI